MLRYLFAIAVFVMSFAVSAKDIVVNTQGESPFLDTEVATNVAFNVQRNDTRTLGVHLELLGSVSNCVQVAFGCDADGNGDLAPEETDLVLGWRRGRYFIEDVERESRVFSASSEQTDASRFLQMTVTTDADLMPKTASFTNEVGSCFTDIGVPECLFRTSWNLAKITRRGAVAAGEWCKISSSYRYFVIRLR